MDLQIRLLQHLQAITGDRNPYFAQLAYLAVRSYIMQTLSQYGQVEIDEFSVKNQIHQNIVLSIPADPQKSNKSNKPTILIGANYDSVPGSPGADDNATGVAVLLELAREFTEKPLAYPVKLIAFDLEEYGLLGSQHYAEKILQSGEKLRLMLSLEMLGYRDKKPGSQKYPSPLLAKIYPPQADFIALVGNIPTLLDLWQIKGKIQKQNIGCEILPVWNKGMSIPDTRRSDHSPFWDLDYPAVMVTDTANMRNPHYHKSTDTIDTLDLEFLLAVCQGLINGLRVL
jgi:Zn-dependent M28 family amino/carboxypeptidase